MQRIGVFVCHCGTNIAATVDVKKVVDVISKEPGVVHAEDYQYMCSETGQQKVIDAIQNEHLTGVVIDRFGRDVMLLPVDEHHFSVSVKVEVSPQFFGWVCGLGKGVRIVSPAAVVEQMGEYVKEIANMY